MAEFFLNDFFVNIDVAVYSFIDKIASPALDGIFTFITHLGDTPGIIWFVLGIILLIPKKTRKLGILMFAGLAFSSLINNVVLKEIIDRPRPYNVDPSVWTNAGYEYVWPGLIKQSSSWSFPSGHTSTSIGAAFALLLGCRKKHLAIGIPAFILSLAIGFSRIYVKVHYPTDVIAGALVGLIAAVAIYFIFDLLVFKKAIPALEKKINKKII
ncbi:MAG: phosphatase PAP2 family protein [Ruminococcaceae bacterium]|nr:phosphatase PAP2 family protein [Oscillospiraceae bacterium]